MQAQERELAFTRFDKNDAYTLGTIAANIILERGVDLAVDVILRGHHVFRAVLNDCDQETDDWLPKKAAVAQHFGESSLLVKYRHEAAGTLFTDLDLDHTQYRAFGGSVPLRVDGVVAGTITLSGTGDEMEHEVAIEALRKFLSLSSAIS